MSDPKSNHGCGYVPLYKRGMQWATRCSVCDMEILMARAGSRAAMLRLLGAVGRKCVDCRPTQKEKEHNE